MLQIPKKISINLFATSFLLALLVCNSANVMAQTINVVKGKVLDKITHEPVESAVVRDKTGNT